MVLPFTKFTQENVHKGIRTRRPQLLFTSLLIMEGQLSFNCYLLLSDYIGNNKQHSSRTILLEQFITLSIQTTCSLILRVKGCSNSVRRGNRCFLFITL